MVNSHVQTAKLMSLHAVIMESCIGIQIKQNNKQELT